MWHDNGHGAFLVKKVKPIEQKGKVCHRLGRKSIALEPELCHLFSGIPAVAERVVDHHCIKVNSVNFPGTDSIS